MEKLCEKVNLPKDWLAVKYAEAVRQGDWKPVAGMPIRWPLREEDMEQEVRSFKIVDLRAKDHPEALDVDQSLVISMVYLDQIWEDLIEIVIRYSDVPKWIIVKASLDHTSLLEGECPLLLSCANEHTWLCIKPCCDAWLASLKSQMNLSLWELEFYASCYVPEFGSDSDSDNDSVASFATVLD